MYSFFTDCRHNTAYKYRKNQLRGYELYEKFLSTIIPDSLGYMDAFTRKAMLEKFIERNFEDVAELRNDTSYIDNEQVSVLFGVKFREAVLHYSKKWLIKRNERLIDKKEKMFAKYVKNPLDINGVKLDSVVNQGPNGLKYCYRYPPSGDDNDAMTSESATKLLSESIV